MKSYTDPRIDADQAILKRMRKKFSIDFVKWTDDAGSAGASIEGVIRHGHWATLHSVRPKTLLTLPDQVLGRPLAQLEVSIDFVAKKATSDEEQLLDLCSVYDLLHRRLAPWQGRHLREAMRRSLGRRHKEKMMTDARRTGVRAGGTSWTKDDLKPVSISAPRIAGAKLIESHTVYFGFTGRPSWSNWRYAPKAAVGVRLYIKTTDKEAVLPRERWSVRMEATLNGPPLDAVLGVRTLRDLQGADMRKLVGEYMCLSTPQAAPAMGMPRMPDGVMKAVFAARFRQIADRDAAAAVAEGNFTRVREGLVTFEPAPALDRSIRAAGGEFRRAVVRARKKLGIGAGGVITASLACPV